MKKCVFILISFLFQSALANVFDYESSVQNIKNNITLSDIRLRFTQERTFKNLDKPVISKGDFVFKKDEGAYFYVTYPLTAQIEYTKSSSKDINSIVNAVMKGQYDKIEKEFYFFFKKENESFELGMKPKEGSRGYDYISSIEIYGDKYIKQIILIMKNGNKTQIWFQK